MTRLFPLATLLAFSACNGDDTGETDTDTDADTQLDTVVERSTYDRSGWTGVYTLGLGSRVRDLVELDDGTLAVAYQYDTDHTAVTLLSTSGNFVAEDIARPENYTQPLLLTRDGDDLLMLGAGKIDPGTNYQQALVWRVSGSTAAIEEVATMDYWGEGGVPSSNWASFNAAAPLGDDWLLGFTAGGSFGELSQRDGGLAELSSDDTLSAPETLLSYSSDVLGAQGGLHALFPVDGGYRFAASLNGPAFGDLVDTEISLRLGWLDADGEVISAQAVNATGALYYGDAEVVGRTTFVCGRTSVSFADEGAPTGDAAAVVLRINGEGELDWVSRPLGTAESRCTELEVGPDGMIYVGGRFDDESGISMATLHQIDAVTGEIQWSGQSTFPAVNTEITALTASGGELLAATRTWWSDGQTYTLGRVGTVSFAGDVSDDLWDTPVLR